MAGWPDRRVLDLVGACVPIVQAPMAGAGGVDLAIAAIRAGAVGSLPCAMLTPEQVRVQAAQVRTAVAGPLNLNFFCHSLPDPPDESAWRAFLAAYYAREQVTPATTPLPLRLPFDAEMCEAVEYIRPTIVSLHFGLPDPALLDRVRATGACIFGNATSPDEAAWLAARGCDAIIAQGWEAGGHAGYFRGVHQPVPTLDLTRWIATHLTVPVIAAGGIVDGTDMAATLSAGASAVQIGTAFLATPQSSIAAPYRALLGTPAAANSVFTNIFSGRPARGIRNRLMVELGAMRDDAPPFPYASAALAPLRARAEADGRGDYSPLWAGTGAARVRPMPAATLVETLARDARAILEDMIDA